MIHTYTVRVWDGDLLQTEIGRLSYDAAREVAATHRSIGQHAVIVDEES